MVERGLYPNTSDMQQDYSDVRRMTNFLAYADGTKDLIDIAEKINESALSQGKIMNFTLT